MVPDHRVRRRRAARRLRHRQAAPARPRGHRRRPRRPRRPGRHPSRLRPPRRARPEEARRASSPRTSIDELMALQDEGLVHRDIKPQNIMLTRQGAKLLDFNIASRVGDPVRHAVRHAAVPGARRRLHPVGRLHRPVRRRRDAVRAALQRRAPVPGAEADGGRGGARPDAVPARSRRGAAPDFLIRACAPYREDRFGTAVEMREALEGVRGGM